MQQEKKKAHCFPNIARITFISKLQILFGFLYSVKSYWKGKFKNTCPNLLLVFFLHIYFKTKECYFWETVSAWSMVAFRKEELDFVSTGISTVRSLLKVIVFLMQSYNYQNIQLILPPPCLILKGKLAIICIQKSIQVITSRFHPS